MKFREIISIIVIILAIILTFLNNCSLGRVFETFTDNVPTVSALRVTILVLYELYGSSYPCLFYFGDWIEEPYRFILADLIPLPDEGAKDGLKYGKCYLNGIYTRFDEIMEIEKLSTSTDKTPAQEDIIQKIEIDCSNNSSKFKVPSKYKDCEYKNYKDKSHSSKETFVNNKTDKINEYCIELREGDPQGVDCLELGKRALEFLKIKMKINVEYTDSQAKTIGKKILNCYVAIKENAINKTAKYNDNLLEQIKQDTKSSIDKLLNLDQLSNQNVTPESYPRNRTPTQNTGNNNNNNNVETSNMNELNDFISKKRKIKQVCNFIKNSQNVNSNSPGVETNKRTTNQFGNNDWHQSNKYPTILETDPKPYNGMMNLF